MSDGWTAQIVGVVGAYGPSLNRCFTPVTIGTGTPEEEGGMRVGAWPMQGAWTRGHRFGWRFVAPPRTDITGVSAEVIHRHGSGRAPIATPWRRGVFDVQTGVTLDFPVTGETWAPFVRQDLSLAEVSVGFLCEAEVCGFPGWLLPFGLPEHNHTQLVQGDFSQDVGVRHVVLTIQDDAPPSIGAVSLPAGKWLTESEASAAIAVDDNVGVHALGVQIDGVPRDGVRRDCYTAGANTLRRPCGDASSLGVKIPVATLTDGSHSLRFTAVDVADNGTAKTINIRVDRTAPAAPRALQLEGEPGWRTSNAFSVSWHPPLTDAGSPVDAAVYELCPAGANGSEGCDRGERTGNNITRIDGLAVPGPGKWQLRVALRDEAGNVDWNRSVITGPLHFDGDRPNAAFLPFDPSNPTQVRLLARDAASGVASVEIEARRRGDNTWHSLVVARDGDHFAAALDDNELPDGLYDLRARVVDHAGNDRTTSELHDGGALYVRLPIRGTSVLEVGNPQRVRVKSARQRPTYKRVLVAKPQARYGQPVEIEGKLGDAAGNPRAGSVIKVLERVDLPGRDWLEIAAVRTSASGAFKFKALGGPARTLRFVYPGTATTRSRTEDVELQVRAGVTLRPSRRTAWNGDEVIFRGRLQGQPIPAAGKLLALQAKTARGWRTFATPRARATDGRFSADYRFTGTSVTARYTFRVVVPKESGYPYAWGASPLTSVLVRGNG
jgi:hypothetical protein